MQTCTPIENEVELHQPLALGVQKLQANALYPPLFWKAFGDSTITEANVLKALAQFERTLISANSRYDQYLAGKQVLSPDEKEGMKLFMTHPEPSIGLRGGNCGDCHGGTLLSLRATQNNRLDEAITDLGYGAVTGRAVDNGKFKVPSLRNIARTAPKMHIRRFENLDEGHNHSTGSAPSNELVWDTGYKSLTLMGSYTGNTKSVYLVLHVGGDDNHKTLTLRADVNALFEDRI